MCGVVPGPLHGPSLDSDDTDPPCSLASASTKNCFDGSGTGSSLGLA